MENSVQLLLEFSFWHWLILGGALFLLEIILSGKWCLWVGIAAVATGFAASLFPEMSPALQIVLFAAVSVSTIYGGRMALQKDGTGSGKDLSGKP